MSTEPKFALWQAVTMRYSDWSRDTYLVDCFIHSFAFFERAEWDAPGYFYMLRIPHIYDLDPVDYRALEGENRDLYGWVSESALTLRVAGTEGIPGS